MRKWQWGGLTIFRIQSSFGIICQLEASITFSNQVGGCPCSEPLPPFRVPSSVILKDVDIGLKVNEEWSNSSF
jgi:hypothetical protein